MRNLIVIGLTLILLVTGIFAITAFEKQSNDSLISSDCNGSCTSENFCSSSACTAKTTGECNCGSCNSGCSQESPCGSSQCQVATTSKCGCKK
jgi:hypothetical protein